jgi:hypothetical protein
MIKLARSNSNNQFINASDIVSRKQIKKNGNSYEMVVFKDNCIVFPCEVGFKIPNTPTVSLTLGQLIPQNFEKKTSSEKVLVYTNSSFSSLMTSLIPSSGIIIKNIPQNNIQNATKFIEGEVCNSTQTLSLKLFDDFEYGEGNRTNAKPFNIAFDKYINFALVVKSGAPRLNNGEESLFSMASDYNLVSSGFFKCDTPNPPPTNPPPKPDSTSNPIFTTILVFVVLGTVICCCCKILSARNARSRVAKPSEHIPLLGQSLT